ncbi:hypothetical protein [Nocardioides sp. WS12]|uniref:hypothetical protein n=1 Tax=Nocardioides sp. WS12 TaxID=2486272 RepID=UPI0015F9A0BD|nr:hypothetical protein [Nocardioides sp. WS12]
MDGIVESGDTTTRVVVVEAISDEFESHLRERLAAYCYGGQQSQEDRDYYSLERTISEFLTRYKAKHLTTQVGMAGELIVHLMMPQAHAQLESAAVYFNKEERSIKKGFDLTFHSTRARQIWYGEVKSGEVGPDQSADEKSASLLKAASADITDKLGTGAQVSRWDSALIDAVLTLESPQARSAKELLRSDAKAVSSGNDFKKNVVLAAAVMHDLEHCVISDAGVIAAVNDLKNKQLFAELCVLVVQQHEVETIVAILEGMSANAAAS